MDWKDIHGDYFIPAFETGVLSIISFEKCMDRKKFPATVHHAEGDIRQSCLTFKYPSPHRIPNPSE
jgi:hypothetical protein